MKLKDLIVARNVLQSIKYQPVNTIEEGNPPVFVPVRMPAKLAYAIEKNERLMEPELQAHEAGRLKILENVGVKPGEKIPEDKEKEANEEYQKLIEMAADFQPYKVTIDIFGNMELDSEQMKALWWMIDEA